MPKGWKLTVAEITNEDQLEKVRGFWIYAERKDLPVPATGEYYVQDLIGLPGINSATGESIGIFKELVEVGDGKGKTFQHTWLFETPQGEELLVPAVPHFVRSVNLEEKKIYLTNLETLQTEDEE